MTNATELVALIKKLPRFQGLVVSYKSISIDVLQVLSPHMIEFNSNCCTNSQVDIDAALNILVNHSPKLQCIVVGIGGLQLNCESLKKIAHLPLKSIHLSSITDWGTHIDEVIDIISQMSSLEEVDIWDMIMNCATLKKIVTLPIKRIALRQITYCEVRIDEVVDIISQMGSLHYVDVDEIELDNARRTALSCLPNNITVSYPRY